MKTKLVLLLVLVLAAGVAGGWLMARRLATSSPGPGPFDKLRAGPESARASRKPVYYQSAMHPWIKSDQPGRCTICGMELTPVYAGEHGFDTGEGIVKLDSNIIQVIHVQTAEVRRQPLARQFRFAGTIDDNDMRHRIVSAYVEGRIDELAVNYVGAEVTAGQPLATFYSPTLLAAEREHVSLQHSLAGNPANADELKRLLASSAERLQRLGLSPAQISALPTKAETNHQSEILAPQSGTVTARHVYAGQYVKEGEKLFEIGDFSTMWLLFDAYEVDLAWLKPGQPVEVTTPALPGHSITGAVTFIDPNLKEQTRSAKVRVELPNPLLAPGEPARRLLYHKLYADALVRVDTPEVLAVPRTAVLFPGPQPVVYVDREGGGYEMRRVKLGRVGDEAWEVLDGLREGERVVTTGNLLIDAQAQLAQTALHAAPAPAVNRPRPSPARTEFTAEQIKSIDAFLTTASAVAEVLAADNLAGFNQQATRVHAAMPALLKAFDAHPPWQPLVERIEATGHLENVSDLPAARKLFHPFSEAVATFATELRQQAAFSTIKIYQCPMVDRAIPGAPKIGRWLQRQEPLRNPFFGAEMLDCGTEVK